MKGKEELNEHGPRRLGNYLVETEHGRVLLLRGKFKGAYLDTIPAGYIGRFMLEKCRDDMTVKEVELCTRHAGDSTTKKVKKRVQMTTIHKVQVEVAAGKGIAEAFDVAAKNGCTEISLTIPVPKTRQKPTAQERLRTRATALELIGSCLVAGDKELARQSFRSALLEHLHAHLSEVFDASCHFTTLAELIADDQAQDPVLLSKKLDQAVAVPLIKEHEIFAEKGKDDRAPVVRIELEQMHTPIQEPLHKAFCQLVDQYAQTVSQHIDPFVRARIQQLGPGQTSFGIIPELTPLTLDTTLDRTELVTAGSVSLYASHHWG